MWQLCESIDTELSVLWLTWNLGATVGITRRSSSRLKEKTECRAARLKKLHHGHSFALRTGCRYLIALGSLPFVCIESWSVHVCFEVPITRVLAG
jgi:hypothetical protein